MKTKPTREQFEAFNAHRRQIIKQFGFMVQGVFATKDSEDDENKTSFMYTIGRAQAAQLDIICMLAIDQQIVNVTAQMIDFNLISFPTPLDKSDVFEIESFHVNINGENKELRAQLLFVNDIVSVIEQYACGTMNPDLDLPPPLGFWQLVLGDKNNILPGEAGYDESFVQKNVTNLRATQFLH